MSGFKRSLLSIAILASFSSQAFAGKAFPYPPSSYVYDDAGAIDESTKSKLFSILGGEDQKTGNQILIAVFKSLDGEEAVDYTNRLFKFWNPGKKGKNNGVLIAAYMAEHKIRIEVGYGLEPELTDAKTRMIIENSITPAFKSQEYSRGMLDAVTAVLGVLHPDQATAPFPTPIEVQSESFPANGPFPTGILILVIIIFLFRIFGGRRRGFGGGGFFIGGGGGGWSSGGGGGGFGGFSGGGGSSGGGGASGSW